MTHIRLATVVVTVLAAVAASAASTAFAAAPEFKANKFPVTTEVLLGLTRVTGGGVVLHCEVYHLFSGIYLGARTWSNAIGRGLHCVTVARGKECPTKSIGAQ